MENRQRVGLEIDLGTSNPSQDCFLPNEDISKGLLIQGNEGILSAIQFLAQGKIHPGPSLIYDT